MYSVSWIFCFTSSIVSDGSTSSLRGNVLVPRARTVRSTRARADDCSRGVGRVKDAARARDGLAVQLFDEDLHDGCALLFMGFECEAGCELLPKLLWCDVRVIWKLMRLPDARCRVVVV